METLKMDFKINRKNNSLVVNKEFAAPVDIVWSYWTRAESLDKWWAPKPWKAKTKSMNFKKGGEWLYTMIGPDGEEHHALAKYEEIIPEQRFEGIDAFSDKDGKINEELPQSYWKVEFEPEGSRTMVTITTKFETAEALEKTLQMGFQEGFTSALGNLDKLLQS